MAFQFRAEPVFPAGTPAPLQELDSLAASLFLREIMALAGTPFQAQEAPGAPADTRATGDGLRTVEKKNGESENPEAEQLGTGISSLIGLLAALAPATDAVVLPWSFSLPRISEKGPVETAVSVAAELKPLAIECSRPAISFVARMESPSPPLVGPKLPNGPNGVNTPAPAIQEFQNEPKPAPAPRMEIPKLQNEPNQVNTPAIETEELQNEPNPAASPRMEIRKLPNEPKGKIVDHAPAPDNQIAERTQAQSPRAGGASAPGVREYAVSLHPNPGQLSHPGSEPSESKQTDPLKPIEPPIADRPRSPLVREISLRLPDQNGGSVEVQIIERAGKVNVIVRTPDVNLGQTLRGELTQLVRTFHEKGLEIQTWTPPETHPNFDIRAATAPERMRSEEHADGSGSSAGQQNESPNSGNQQQRRQQHRPEWLMELERKLKKED
ncbi:MAG TPA: hypothetical protein VMZ52_01440 [Bryobacteraceae bacterium]|nr:hypothetical protein [Bryobacteraceae bacterium]